MHNPSMPERPDPLENEQTKALLENMTRAGTRTFRILIALEGLVIVALVGAVVYLLIAQANATYDSEQAAAQAIQTNDQRWCATMGLLTATPVTPPADPASNPSRVASYKLYEDFLALKKGFKCA